MPHAADGGEAAPWERGAARGERASGARMADTTTRTAPLTGDEYLESIRDASIPVNERAT
jgi:hypothetical protein